MKNKSEMLLEGYLRYHGHRDFDFEPEILGSSQRPDYRLRWAGGEVLLEVKEFRAVPGELGVGFGAFDPYAPLLEKIDQGRQKFRQLKGHCCALVLYNVDKPLVFLDWQHVQAAMLGKLGWQVPIHTPRRPAPSENDITTVFTSGGRMHRESHGVPYAPQNQTISAIVVLDRIPAGERLFHTQLDELRAHRGDAFDLDTHLLQELEASRWTLRDTRRRPLRVVVCENPYARIPFPRGLFCGSWDERYGPLEGRIQQLHLGEDAARIPPEP